MLQTSSQNTIYKTEFQFPLTFKTPNIYHFLQILDQCAADSNFGSQMDFLNLHEYICNREMGEPKSAAYPLPQKFEFQR